MKDKHDYCQQKVNLWFALNKICKYLLMLCLFYFFDKKSLKKIKKTNINEGRDKEFYHFWKIVFFFYCYYIIVILKKSLRSLITVIPHLHKLFECACDLSLFLVYHLVQNAAVSPLLASERLKFVNSVCSLKWHVKANQSWLGMENNRKPLLLFIFLFFFWKRKQNQCR